MVELKI